MGKKKKAFLDLRRFGKVRKKWETKFAKLLEANLASIRETVETVAEKVEEILETPKQEEVLVQAEKPTVKTPTVEEAPKPKTTHTPAVKKVATTKKATTTKKTATTTRRKRTTKTKS